EPEDQVGNAHFLVLHPLLSQICGVLERETFAPTWKTHVVRHFGKGHELTDRQFDVRPDAANLGKRSVKRLQLIWEFTGSAKPTGVPGVRLACRQSDETR